jgi:hypothetical protein
MGIPLDRSNRLLGLTDSFATAFPTLDDAIIRYTESDFGNDPRQGVWSLKHNGGQMRCGNPRCYRGGYELDREVSNMIYAGITEREIWLTCNGDEGSPKGRKKGQECLHSIKGTITLRMKQPQQPEAEKD